MLKANKSLWFEKIFAVYNRNLLRRRFNSLRATGLKNLVIKDEVAPLIIYANHSSWWDGLVAFQISRQMNLDSYLMMEEKQLERLHLFRKLGAFSVVRENARKALESVNYATQILKQNTKRAVWIFPQGTITRNDARPLQFYNGLARIIVSLENCSVISAAIRYEFLGEYKPDIFVKIENIELSSADLNCKPQKISAHLAKQLTESLDELKTDIINGKTSDYEKIC